VPTVDEAFAKSLQTQKPRRGIKALDDPSRLRDRKKADPYAPR
jgi:hypothetical protein